MLEHVESPETVLAFRAIGKIEKADYDTVLEPAIKAMLDARDELRFVYVLGDDFDGYTSGAGWKDAKLGMGHITKWKRCAIVSDKEWVHHYVGMFRWMMPGDLKIFAVSDLANAIEWAAA
jgi:hypothetical protein